MNITSIAHIISERDGLDYSEALAVVEDVVADINDILDEENGSLEMVETIFMEELGLEPDYLMDILFF